MNNNNQQVVLPRRSRRLATIIPASHWISLGYSNEEAQSMEKLQNDMKKYIDGSDEDIELKGDPGGTLPYHDMLLPHWQKLAKALHGRTNTKVLNIFCISLPTPVLDIMLPAIQSMNLSKLSLNCTCLGTGGFMKFSSFLGYNTSLKRIVLSEYDDRIDDLSVATSLSNAIKSHPILERVSFVGCGLNNADTLRIILEGCKRLNRVFIMNAGLKSECVGIISEFISKNYPTETIMLNYNKISDNDTVLLASAIKMNTNLRQLDVRDNDITEEGEKILLKALFDPTSMDSVVDSNHMCMTYTYDISNASLISQRQRPLLETEVFKIILDDDMSIQKKIRKKVVLALSGVYGCHFDLSHFNDLPLQLMPRVLELIQEHTAMRRSRNTPIQLEKDALTRLFHTLRGWELPLLFENLIRPSRKRKRRKTRRH